MGDVKFFYPEFVPNQILTNTQLNQLRAQLEQQDLATRLRLAGTGIACGFTWSIVTSPKPAIRLTGGYGISSAGALIEQCDPALYTHRRKYNDPDRDETEALRYVQWRDPADATHQTQRDIIELIDGASAQDVAGAQALTAAELTGPGAITLNRVLVLYLEHRPEELNSCLVTSCDNRGLNINVRVRALLVNEADLTRAPECAAAPTLKRIPRMHKAGLPQPEQAFAKLVSDHVSEVGNNIKALFEAHAEFLDVMRFPADPLAGKLTGTQPAQYRYDALLDFACAYNEAALAVHALINQCCPAGDYPRHLMLGALDGTPRYRNEFVPAATRNVVHGELERVHLLFLRLRAMVGGLDFGRHPAAVTIQASHGAESPLGRRALPYYFSGIAPGFWRPRPRCGVDPDWPWRTPLVATSLDTDYGEATWLRIEGHVSKSHVTAAAEVRQQRDAGNVEFCLLRTYVDDGAGEETARRSRIAVLLAGLLQADDRLRTAVASVVATGNGDFEQIAESALQRSKLNDEIAEASRSWLALREQRELYCDWAAAGHDYLEARSELFCVAVRVLGMLQRLQVAVDLADAKALTGPGLEAMLEGTLHMLADRIVGAVLALPQQWGTPERVKARLDWGALPKLDDAERLRLALRLALETLYAQVRALIEQSLPKSLSRFDYEVFAARYREVARGLLEFDLWTRVLGGELTDANDGRPARNGDAPLHAAESGNIVADLLALARSCSPARLATASVVYEALRGVDLSLYRNLSKIDGLEHLAGVAKGGSFILLCDTSAAEGKVVGDFSLERCLPCCCEIDLDALCLPPLALPDVRVVKLHADGAKGYFPVELSISVGANDYDLNGVQKTAPLVAIELPSDKSEHGAALAARSEVGAVKYRLEGPVPGVIDRFRYRLRIRGEKCGGEAIGEVALIFAVDAQVSGAVEGTVFNVGRDGIVPEATVRLIGTGLDTRTDSKGRFRFGDVVPGSYGVEASHGTRKSEVAVVDVHAGATATLELVLKETVLDGTVAVQVLGTLDKPISKAEVTLKNESGSFVQTNFTAPAGDTLFRNVPTGRYMATGNAQGYLSGIVGPFTLAAGQTLAHVIRLKAAGGTVPTVTVEHVASTLDVGALEAAVVVRRTLSDRYAKYVNVLNKATEDPTILVSEPYTRAAEFLANGLADPRTEAEIAADYKEVSSALGAAAKQSTGEAKSAYQEALSAVSMAYLDYVAASSPATLTPEATAEVKAVGAALKTAEISSATLRTRWAGETLGESLRVGTVGGIGGLLG